MEKKGNAGWAVLGFFIPLVGLILWLVWKDSKPEDSHQAGKGALIGVIVAVVIAIVFVILQVTLFASAANTVGSLVNDTMQSMSILG